MFFILDWFSKLLVYDERACAQTLVALKI